MNNYPDGMDWGAYDDYHDPKLQCGCHSSDGCGCWCEHYLHDKQHRVGECDEENCALYSCSKCDGQLTEKEIDDAQDKDEPQTCKGCLNGC